MPLLISRPKVKRFPDQGFWLVSMVGNSFLLWHTVQYMGLWDCSCAIRHYCHYCSWLTELTDKLNMITFCLSLTVPSLNPYKLMLKYMKKALDLLVICFTMGPIIGNSSFPHETQINAFFEMNRRPEKIESSFSEVRKGCISGNSHW